MSAKLFVITGASGCGKTTLLNHLVADDDLCVVKAPKYSSRAVRDDSDDIIHDNDITREKYDLVYKLNGKTYGIKVGELKEQLAEGRHLLIILSDIRVVSRLKKELGDKVVAWYISSAIDEVMIGKIQAERYKGGFVLSENDSFNLYKQFLKLRSSAELKDWGRLFDCMGGLIESWDKYIPEKNSTEVRKNKIRDFHKTYIDKITLFDHVILNHNYRDPLEMTIQAKNIVRFYDANDARLKKRSPAVFIVSAASGSGKGMLMESVREVIGLEQISIITKQAKRAPKDNDRLDGMQAIGERGVFPPEFNLIWTFHKGEYHSGTEYAVSEKEIRENLREGRPQIFISNMQQMPMFKALLGDHAVFLYLHATRSDEDIRRFQYDKCKTKKEAEQRIAEIEDVHKSYIENIAQFDHVLLNTAFPEDLYEQMFGLIDYYHADG